MSEHKLAGVRLRLLATVLTTCLAAVAGGQEDSQKGIVYYPAQHRLQLQVDTTTTTTRSIDPADCSKPKEAMTQSFQVTASLVRVAQTACPLPLGDLGGTLAKTELTVDLSKEGFLQGVNAKSEGQGPQIVQSIAKLAGSILGGLPAVLGAALQSDSETKLSPKAACFANETEDGKHLFSEGEKLRAALGDLRDQQTVLLRQIKATSQDDLPILEKKLTLLSGSLAKAQAAATANAAAFDNGLASYQTRLRLGAKSATSSRTFNLELNELPQADVVSEHEVDGSAIVKALSGKAKAVYKASGVFATLDPPIAATGDDCPVTAPDPPKRTMATVYYRHATPHRIRIFVPRATKISDNSSNIDFPRDVRLAQEQNVLVFNGSAPLQLLALKKGAFGQRSLGITFGNDGELKKVVNKVEKTAAADALGAFAKAPEQIASSYASTLKTIAGTLEDRRKILFSGLDDEIARLTKEKTRVDHEIELLGIEGNRELLLQQLELDAQIETLKKQKAFTDAELGLEVATSTYDAQLQQKQLESQLNLLTADLNLKKGKTTFQTNLQLAQIQAELALLRQRLDFSKAEAGFGAELEKQQLQTTLELLRLQQQLLELQEQIEALRRGSSEEDSEEG